MKKNKTIFWTGPLRLLLWVGYACSNERTYLKSNQTVRSSIIESDTSLLVVHYEGDCTDEELEKNPDCGFETIKSFNGNTKSLYRIIHNEFGDSTRGNIFYYLNNKLVYAKTEKGYVIGEEYTIIHRREIFLSNGQVIHESGIGSRMPPDVLKQLGLTYLIAHNKMYSNQKNGAHHELYLMR